MNTHFRDHEGQKAVPSANPSIHAKIRSKVRKNGNGQSMASKSLSTAVHTALLTTRATREELLKNAPRTGGFNPSAGIAIGHDASTASANANGDIAIGGLSTANSGASGNNEYATGVGDVVVATGTDTSAFGNRASATSIYATAIGAHSIANSNASTAVGSYSTAGSVATALGTKSVASGGGSTAVGDNAQASGGGAVSIGWSSAAVGAGAIALGAGPNTQIGASASADYSMALGYVANASANNAIAIGANTNVRGPGSIALGDGATTYSAAAELAYAALAMGAQATATGWGTTAIGAYAQATATTWSTALGSTAKANGNRSVAVGYFTNASGVRSVALGMGSVADRDNTVSVGGGDTARRQIVNLAAGTQGMDAVNVNQLSPVVTALGGGAAINATTGAVTGPTYTLVNGGKQTTVSGALNALDTAVSDAAGGAYDKYLNVKAGTAADDLNAQAGNSATALGPNANANAQSAVALGGNTVAGFNAIAIGTLAQGTGQDSSAVGLRAKASGLRSSTFGAFSTASADSSTSMGHSSNAIGVAATALGQAASAAGNYSVAVGIQANAVGSNAVVIGAGAISGRGAANVDGDGNVVIGANALFDNTGAGAILVGRNTKVESGVVAKGTGTIVVGDGAKAYGDCAIVIGSNAYAAHTDGVAIGRKAQALENGPAVALGPSTLADEVNTVSVGNRSTGRRYRIVNMESGWASYDAVNVSQLQTVVTALGGGAAIDTSTGAVTGPTYTLANGGTQTTLSGALRALDQAVSNAGGENDKYFAVNSTGPAAVAGGNDAIGLGSGANAAGDNAVALGTNSRADAANTVSVGTPGGERKIVNVADGDVSVTSTDAVTGAQLYETSQQLDVLEGALKNSGVIDPGTGESLAVAYGTVTKDTLPLGSAGSPVAITNVATAVAQTGAVNLSQMNAAMDTLRGELSPSIAYLKVDSTGLDATASGVDAVALGSEAVASKDDALAAGVRARASAEKSVALGSDSLAARDMTVSVGNKPAGLKRRLVNMDAGTDADDAVSVSQLQPVLTALGGDASIDPVTGAVTGPTYTFADGSVHNSLEDALGALDDAVNEGGGANNPYLAINSTGADAVANGNDAISLGTGASAAGNNAVALGAHSQADAADTVSVGAPGNKRKIVNVAQGDVSAASTDAVTGGQLYASNQVVEALKTTLTGSGLIDPSGASLAVTYVNASKNIVSLGNLGVPVEIMNVADGLVNSDAATVGQVTNAVSALRTEVSKNLNYVKVNSTGTNAIAVGTNAVAIGSNATTSNQGAVAIGTGADVSGENSVALGYNSEANENNVISVGYAGGERKIVNVADGAIESGSTDAINGGQLFDALGARATRAGGAGIFDVTDPMAAVEGVKGDNTASLNDNDPNAYTAMAYGVKSTASGANTAAFGLNNTAGFDNSVAIGVNTGTGADQPYSVAVGSKATTRGSYAIAFGANVEANANNAVAIGTSTGVGSTNRTQALGVSSIAIGDTAKDRGVSGIAIGKTASVATGATSCIAVGTSTSVATNLSDAIAIGTSASVAAGSNGGVALGQGAVANRGNAVSLGATTGSTPVGTRQIINLSMGTQATDAVNVSQLQGVTTALGGGAGVGVDGSIVPPSYTVNGTPYADVGTAINAAANMSDPNAVSYDDTTKDEITFGGATGTLLTHVSPGGVATDSEDAINGAQLFGTAQSIATGLGGGAAVDQNGIVTPPTYVFDNKPANDVGNALINLYAQINNQLADSGLVDQNGQSIAAVTYDGSLQNRVTLGGTGATAPVTVTNVAPGNVLSDTSTDAVNGLQLYETNQQLDATNQAIVDLTDALESGGVLDPTTGESLAVTYGDNSKTDIELGAAGTPVTVSNVKAGTQATDAVNIGQLQGAVSALGGGAGIGADGSIEPPSYTVGGMPYSDVGAALNAVASMTDPNAVSYDDTSKDEITFGGAAGTLLTNVGEGSVAANSADAINGAQLFGTAQTIATGLGGGATVNPDGTVTPPQYVIDGTPYPSVGAALNAVAGMTDPNAVSYDDTSKDEVTFGGAAGTLLTNVGEGNVAANSADAINGAQLFGTAQTIATGLGGGATVNPDGTVTPPQYVIDGTTADDVGGAITNLYTVINQQLADSGLVDQNGQPIAAVTYDGALQDKVTLGGTGASSAVTVSNVKPGDATSATSTEAVNGGQLYAVDQKVIGLEDTLESSGLIDPVTGESLAVTYDDASKDGVTLGGAGAAAVPLHNMATGMANTDGVNVAQLNTGLTNLETKLTSSAINLKYIKVNATGTQANANGTNAISIGSNVNATGVYGVAIGTGASVTGDNSVAVGYNSLADDDNVFSVGVAGYERRIINVADGDVSALSTEAINGGQLYAVRKALDALAATQGAKEIGVNDVADPVFAVEGRSGHNVASLNGGDLDASTAAAIGVFSVASGADAIAVGLHNVAGSDYSVALGRLASTGADHAYAVAVGSDVRINAPRAVALGTQVQANAEHALALGTNKTLVTGRSAIAMGEGVNVRSDNSIAIGRGAMVTANASDALALGAEASVEAGAIGSVALGHGAVADRGNSISIGGGSVGTRQIIHVSAGTEPTDAVNVAQLAQLQEAMAAMRAEIQLLRSQLAARPAQ